jgi:tRNA-2-methylthio-N6-dimethylallyladenosine synthase
MDDNVAPEAKTERYLHLESVVRRRQNEVLQRYQGRTLSVLAEKGSSKSANDLTGHSTCHKVVNFKGSKELLGRIVDVTISDIKSNSLFGEVI